MNEALVVATAQSKLKEVDELVAKLAAAETMLEHGYATLAHMLNEVATFKYWMGTHKSYGAFLDHIVATYQVSKPQLYNYRAAAASLGDIVTNEQLNTMGISKALVLRKAKENVGYIPEKIIAQAVDKDVSVRDLRKILFDASMIEKPEDGEWMDLDMSCYLTADERAMFNMAGNAARHGDPAIAESLPDWMQRKLIMIKLCQEFLSAHANEAIEGGRGIC